MIYKKEGKAGAIKGSKKSGTKQLFEVVKKPVVLLMKQDEKDMPKAPTQRTSDALESEVALLKITEKLSKDNLYYFKIDDLLDTSKYCYGLDE